MGFQGKGRFHTLPRQGSVGSTLWTITRAGATVNAGSAVSWTIARNLNGNVAVATLITFAGQATSLPGAFSQTIGAALGVIDADTPTTGIVGLQKISDLVLEVGPTWSGTPFVVSRGTVDRTGQGDLVCSLDISVDQGVVSGTHPQLITIVDAAVVPAAPVWTRAPSLSGSPVVGGVLTVDQGTVTGVPTPVKTWIFRKDGVDIAGTDNALTYMSVAGDATHTITVHFTATNASGAVTSTSTGVTIVAGGLVEPICTQVTVIRGPNPPQVGSLTFWPPFTWTGNPPPNVESYVYKSGVEIVGADPDGYVPVTGDIAGTLRRVEIASNNVGPAVTAQSAASSAVIAAPVGTLTNVTLSDGFVEWGDTPNADAIAGFQPEGGAITSVAFSASGDAGGRVALSGTAGIIGGAVARNFGMNVVPATTGTPYLPYDQEMNITLNFNSGAVIKNFPLKPRFPDFEVTGGAGGTEVVVSTFAAFAAEMEDPTTAPRIIRLDPAVSAIWSVGQTSSKPLINGKKNWTLVGHRGIILNRGGGFRIRSAENFRIINCCFRAGPDVLGISRQNRDSMEMNSVDRFAIENNDFSWSIDELVSIVRLVDAGLPLPRRGYFYRNVMCEPLYNAAHSTGEPNHMYGSLAYRGSRQAWWIENAFLDAPVRCPTIGESSQSLVQNNFMAHWGQAGGHGATVFVAEVAPNANQHMAIVQGNLGAPLDQSATTRDRFVMLNDIEGGGRIYIAPATSDYANHYIELPGPTFVSDPFDPARAHLRGTATRASQVTTPPMEVPQFPPRPTKTISDREALFDDLLGPTTNVIGCREWSNGDPLTGTPIPGWLAMSKVGHDVMTRVVGTGEKFWPRGGYPPSWPVPNVAYSASLDDLLLDNRWDVSLPSATPNNPPNNPTLSGTQQVVENVANGTVIGIVGGDDPDGDTVTFAIQSDPDSKFILVGLELRKNASMLRATSAAHFITIRATDSFGATNDQAFSIEVLAAATTPPGNTYFASDGMSHPFWTDFMLHSGVYVPSTNKIWVGWDAAPTTTNGYRRARVRVFNRTTGTWSATATIATHAYRHDDHGPPGFVGPDANGYMYSFHGAHGNPQKWARTTTPGDPSAWTALPNFGTAGDYPKPYIRGNDMYCFRQETSNGTTGFVPAVSKGTISAGGNVTWSYIDRKLFICPNRTGGTRFYHGDRTVVGTKIYFAGCFSPFNTLPGLNQFEDIYVFVYDLSNDTVQNARGSFSQSNTSPVSSTNMVNHFRVVTGPFGTANGLIFDHTGKLHLFYGNSLTATLPPGTSSTWTTGVAAPIPPMPAMLYTLPDGRLETISFDDEGGGVTSYRRYTRSLAGVWGTGSAILFQNERTHRIGAGVQNVVNATSSARGIFCEVTANWQPASNIEAGDLRCYLWSDAGVINAPIG